MGEDIAVGTATRYWLRGCSEFEPRWGRDFPHPFRPALAPPPNHLYNGHRGSSGVKRPERSVHHPDLAPTLKGTATPLLLLCAFTVCYGVKFTSIYKHDISYVKLRHLKEFNSTNCCSLTLILRRSRTGTIWFYTSTSNKRAARPKLHPESLTRDLKRMYSRFTLVRISIKL